MLAYRNGSLLGHFASVQPVMCLEMNRSHQSNEIYPELVHVQGILLTYGYYEFGSRVAARRTASTRSKVSSQRA